MTIFEIINTIYMCLSIILDVIAIYISIKSKSHKDK